MYNIVTKSLPNLHNKQGLFLVVPKDLWIQPLRNSASGKQNFEKVDLPQSHKESNITHFYQPPSNSTLTNGQVVGTGSSAVPLLPRQRAPYLLPVLFTNTVPPSSIVGGTGQYFAIIEINYEISKKLYGKQFN